MPTLLRSDTPPCLTVCSGASIGFFRALVAFLVSARKTGWDQRCRFIIFDLGLKAEQWQALQARHPWCEFRRFNFAAHPPHVALAAGHYAWKPILIADLMEECGGRVVWFDSATLLKAGLEELEAGLARYGVYTLAGQSPLSERCDPLTLTALDAPAAILHLPERVAGVVGFDANHPVAARIARQWREHARIEAHIAPRSPRHSWHKPEQAVLSILLYQAMLTGELELNPGEIDISSTQPVRWMTSRNKLPDELPSWAVPLAHAWHGLYKYGDRLALRWERTVLPAIEGALRMPRDHYQVWLRRDGGEPVAVPCPWHGYYADPFLWRQGETFWLFVEVYDYLASRGRLLALELDADLQPRRAVAPLVFPRHVSFPLLFEVEGQLYLLPETHAMGCVDLYVCQDFPDHWTRARRLLDRVDAADSVVFFHGDRWWLITSLWEEGEPARFLAIFWAFDLLAGEWTPHPLNREKRHHGTCPSSLRGGGMVVWHEGAWLRPVQVNPHHYGEGLAVMRIERLDETGFSEVPYQGDHPFAAVARAWSAHHVSRAGEVTAWDVRDRVSYRRTLLSFLAPSR